MAVVVVYDYAAETLEEAEIVAHVAADLAGHTRDEAVVVRSKFLLLEHEGLEANVRLEGEAEDGAEQLLALSQLKRRIVGLSPDQRSGMHAMRSGEALLDDVLLQVVDLGGD